LTTTIHARCDALGNPTGFHLTPGQAHDLEGADALLPGMTADILIADKAFDADERVIEPLREAGKTIVIPQSPIEKSHAPMMKTCTRHGISSRTFSPGSSSSVPLPPAMTSAPYTSSAGSISPLQ